MAWIKIPAENHAPFRAALPARATTKNMFGGIAAFVNDNMFGGLFARSIVVKLAPAHQQEALALDGATPFDPMDNGRIMKDTILLPDSVMDEPSELRMWLQRGFDYVGTLPPKKAKALAAKPVRTRGRAEPGKDTPIAARSSGRAKATKTTTTAKAKTTSKAKTTAKANTTANTGKANTTAKAKPTRRRRP